MGRRYVATRDSSISFIALIFSIVLRRTINARVRGPHAHAHALDEIADGDQQLVDRNGLNWQKEQEGPVSLSRANSWPDKLSDLAAVASWQSSQPRQSNDIQWAHPSPSGSRIADSLMPEKFGLDLSAFLEGEDPLGVDPLLYSGSWSTDCLNGQSSNSS